jgi:hypothetical protein
MQLLHWQRRWSSLLQTCYSVELDDMHDYTGVADSEERRRNSGKLLMHLWDVQICYDTGTL